MRTHDCDSAGVISVRRCAFGRVVESKQGCALNLKDAANKLKIETGSPHSLDGVTCKCFEIVVIKTWVFLGLQYTEVVFASLKPNNHILPRCEMDEERNIDAVRSLLPGVLWSSVKAGALTGVYACDYGRKTMRCVTSKTSVILVKLIANANTMPSRLGWHCFWWHCWHFQVRNTGAFCHSIGHSMFYAWS